MQQEFEVLDIAIFNVLKRLCESGFVYRNKVS